MITATTANRNHRHKRTVLVLRLVHGICQSIPESSVVFRCIPRYPASAAKIQYSRVFRDLPGYSGVFRDPSRSFVVFRRVVGIPPYSRYSDSGGPQFKELFPPRLARLFGRERLIAGARKLRLQSFSLFGCRRGLCDSYPPNMNIWSCSREKRHT